MKAVDSYEMEPLYDNYIFIVIKHKIYGPYGVVVDINEKDIEIIKTPIVGQMISNRTEYNLEIDSLYDELKALSDADIRNLIQSKLSTKKFDL